MARVSERRWYAVHVRSNQERNTAMFYTDRGVEHLLPVYRARSTRKDRHVDLVKPLFKGYLFVHIDHGSEERLNVFQAPGIVRIVGFGNAPTPVPDDTIESIRILMGDEDTVRPHPLVRAGRPVWIADGPFRGAVGILSETADRKPKLVVEIEFLGRAVAVPVSLEQVQPVLD
jgi:transcriptional antiterminator RfaH